MYGNIRKPMLKSAMAAENKTEPEQPGEGIGGMPIFCWSFQSDFTNEMDICYPTGRAGSNGHPVLRFLKPPSWRFRSGY